MEETAVRNLPDEIKKRLSVRRLSVIKLYIASCELEYLNLPPRYQGILLITFI
jgi:hypothetical protein